MTAESRLVARLSRYVDLTPGETSFLAELEKERRTLTTGQTIVSPGNSSDGVFVLRDGWAIVRSQPVRGRSSILRIYLSGEVIGLVELGPPAAPHQITMQTDGVVCPFPRAALARLLNEQPRLGALLSALSSIDQIALRDQCAALGLMTAEDRLIHFLLQLRARLGVMEPSTDERLYLPFSQAEIGEAVGMTPVYVNKLLRKLSGEGRIRVERPYMHLLDAEGMENQVAFRNRFDRIDLSWFPEAA